MAAVQNIGNREAEKPGFRVTRSQQKERVPKAAKTKVSG
jgi:hypothetical protein